MDIGTTGISAVLLQRETLHLYPIYWASIKDPTQKTFRLPAAVYFSVQDTSAQAILTPLAIGDLAESLALQHFATLGAAGGAVVESGRVLVRSIKSFLSQVRVGTDFRSDDRAAWSQTALAVLLATLGKGRSSMTAFTSTLHCGAVGLSQGQWHRALQELAGVVVGYPTAEGSGLDELLRTTILRSGLVSQAEQVQGVTEAIAPVLSLLPSAEGERVQFPDTLQQQAALSNLDWQGNTLVIHAGATLTELVWVSLPTDRTQLHPDQFHRRVLPYAGNAIDQDIWVQWVRSDDAYWGSALALDGVSLPAPGDPNPIARDRLHQYLHRRPLGQMALEWVQAAKLQLQEQEEVVIPWGDRTWTFTRRDFNRTILLPYLQRLNQETDALLTQVGCDATAVAHIICTGGATSFRAIARWLQEKFPQAMIIKDTYAVTQGLGQEAVSIPSPKLTGCSRVAYGLAMVPLYPGINPFRADLPSKKNNA